MSVSPDLSDESDVSVAGDLSDLPGVPNVFDASGLLPLRDAGASSRAYCRESCDE